jgi:membrane protein implicated in regulation of membrane protease activity
MKWPDIYLLCLLVGVLWSIVSLLLGSFHLGHWGAAHGHSGGHMGGHAANGHFGHVHGHTHGAAHSHSAAHAQADNLLLGWFGAMANPSCIAAFLSWFGGVGYLLTKHSGLAFWGNMSLAIALGLVGAWMLAAFLRYLQSKEQPLNPADYDMIGTLGCVASPIRPDGVGEVIYVRDGARCPVPARSEDGIEIRRDEEVIVTRFEKGIAYVRTWDAMTQAGNSSASPKQRSL